MVNIKTRRTSLLIFCFFFNAASFAQDAHYWTEQFGNKSMLLSGTVNASVEDLGLVFYNPARLSQIQNPAFVISAKVYELTSTKIKDGLGVGNDLSKSSFGGAPNLVAGTFNIPFLKGHSFAYSFLTRFRNQSDFNAQEDFLENQEVNDLPYTSLIAKLNSNNGINEEWFGLTWSRKINDKLSGGITMFGYQKDYSSGLILQLNGLQYDNTTDMLGRNRNLSYNAYGLLWKAGLSAELKNINVGLTITTPRMNLFGSGSTTYEDFQSGLDSIKNIPNSDRYIENQQDDLSIKVRSPVSIGLGVGLKLPQSTIHISSEWYAGLRNYTVMESESFIGQQPNDTINLMLVDDLKSVLNFGIGIEHRFNEKISVYGSVASDFTAVNSGAAYLYEFKDTLAHSKFDGNLFHMAGGVALNMKWAELTLGATYAASSRSIPRPFYILGEDLIGEPKYSNLLYKRWRFIVGFSFPFRGTVIKN